MIRIRSFLRQFSTPIRKKVEYRKVNRIVRLAKQQGDIKLDLGCGPFKRPGFIGVDLSDGADLRWNILWGLPFDNNSVVEIRSDHFFEHLALPDIVEVLKECKRVLVPEGVLDFTIPHFDPYLDAYVRRDLEFFKEKICDIPPGQEHLYNTCFDRISWLLLRSGEHKSLFDKESIVAKVRLAGFTEVKLRNFDEARDINPRFSSIYVVAIK